MTRERRRHNFFRIILIAPLFLTAAALLVFTCFYISYSKLVDERLASGYLTSRAGIYAAPRVLRAGQQLSRERLADSLRRAGYVEGLEEASGVWSGRFAVEGASLVRILPRHSSGMPAAFDEVKVEFDKRGRVSSLAGDGTPLESFALEPEPLTHDAGMKTGKHASLSYGDLPPVLVRAVLATEDRRFFEHRGLDPVGIARAFKSWLTGMNDDNDARRQGGSTITQQLVKNTYLTPERTLRRKFNEAILASVLERRLSKEDILALYCNELYLGQRGSAAVRGVEQAARVYFGKELKDLSLAEAATLAGMIQSPARYAPDRHPERARERRNVVLEAMLREGFVTKEEAGAAAAEPVAVVPYRAAEGAAVAPHFIDYINRVVESRLESSEDSDGRALRVYTTIDLELQQLAEESVRRQLERLDKVFKGRKRPQAALVALDPRTGDVLAMVGGRDYAESQLNRATDASRQPGSVFKPIVYATALEQNVSPVSTYTDAPREFRYDVRATYRPSNYGGAFSMRDVTMRTGLVRSLNVVTVDVALRAGLTRVAETAQEFGLPRPQPYPALALGTTEATPLQIAAAYTAFANSGTLARPNVVARVGGAGREDFNAARTAQPRQIIKPSTAYVITDMLKAVVSQGTARAARGAIKGAAFAGKTGTSRDGWFAGYTPNLVCVVWVGFDDGSELGLSGAESALPAWVEFVKGAVELRPELGGAGFAQPAGVAHVEIDPETGMLASPSCPQRERVAVAHAAAPSYECYKHAGLELMLPMVSVEEFDANVVTITTPAEGTTQTHTTPASHVVPRLPPPLPDDTSPAPLSAPVHTRPTQIEIGRNGRKRLTNALTFTAAEDEWKP